MFANDTLEQMLWMTLNCDQACTFQEYAVVGIYDTYPFPFIAREIAFEPQ
jgi:hypothetical protein